MTRFGFIALGALVLPAAAGAQAPAATGTFNGHTYSWYNDAVDFGTAQNRANKLGGYLASVTSNDENEFIYKLTGGTTVFGGGTDQAEEGVWRWLGGAEAGKSFYRADGGAVDIDFHPWSSGEPNDAGGNEDALLLDWSGTNWNDIPVTSGYGYVVEVDPAAGAVPELATWAMMIAGFGLIGAAARRRAARPVAIA